MGDQERIIKKPVAAQPQPKSLSDQIRAQYQALVQRASKENWRGMCHGSPHQPETLDDYSRRINFLMHFCDVLYPPLEHLDPQSKEAQSEYARQGLGFPGSLMEITLREIDEGERALRKEGLTEDEAALRQVTPPATLRSFGVLNLDQLNVVSYFLAGVPLKETFSTKRLIDIYPQYFFDEERETFSNKPIENQAEVTKGSWNYGLFGGKVNLGSPSSSWEGALQEMARLAYEARTEIKAKATGSRQFCINGQG